MQCENCQSEINSDNSVCSKCGALVLQDVEGFRNTKDIERRLKAMVDQHGNEVIADDEKFIALLNDFIPEYDKERSLLKNMLDAGIFKNMIQESNHNIAVMKAKSYMLDKLFISENAAEFVLVCFTYMLGWPYISSLRIKDTENNGNKKENQKKKSAPLNIEEKVFFPLDAVKYRLSGNVTIPEGYTKLESFCFDGYGFLRTIHLPSTLLAIGDYAFSECKRLRGVDLPDSLKIIKQGAFSQCVKLAVINIPKGVLEIEDNTFSFCQNLEVVEIPESVGSIGVSAFSGCEKLRKLFLPESIKFIDKDAFSYCPELVIRCYENSYVHKYCLSNGIKVETVSEGMALKAKIQR